MSYGMTLVKFHNGRMATIPQDAIVAVLVRLGCRVPELREGSNEVGLPHDKHGTLRLGRPPFFQFRTARRQASVCTVHKPLESAGDSCSHSSMNSNLQCFPTTGQTYSPERTCSEKFPWTSWISSRI